MQHTYVNLDFYNNNCTCKINDNNYVFHSVQSFVEKTNFPFAETLGISAYEPERNIFNVEYVGGIGKSGPELPEMVWFANNLENIESAAIRDNAEREIIFPSFVATIRTERDQKLVMTDWVLTRWQEETTINVPHSMTEQKFAEVLMYRQALRNITNTYTSLDDVVWPTNPLE
jgi:hypothetical protein